MAGIQAAAAAYERFAIAFPDNRNLETARLWQGIALRRGEDAEESRKAVDFQLLWRVPATARELAVSAYTWRLSGSRAAGDTGWLRASMQINGFPSSELLNGPLPADRHALSAGT